MPGKALPHHSTAHHSKAQPSRDLSYSADRLLLRLVDVGLGAVIFFAPLFMGGRNDVGRLVFVAAVCFTALMWVARQGTLREARWRWSGAELILLAGLLLIALQLLPLPQFVQQALSPQIGALLPLWVPPGNATVHLGQWQQLSLAPQATRDGLVTYLAYAMLFLVVVQRIEQREDVERLLRWLGLAAIGMAVLGLAQFLLGNGKFLWIYEHPFRDTRDAVKGSFQNQNHFAHFLILGTGPLIWWLQRLWTAPRQETFQSHRHGRPASDLPRQALTIGLGLVAFAGLLTFSRGGVITMFAASAICVGVYYQKRLFGKRALAVIAGLTLVTAAALAIFGYEPLARRLSTLREARSLAEICRGRNALWAAHLKAIPQFPFTGTGVGSHREVYPLYLDETFDVEFTHGENGYLHLLVETGFPGLALLLSGAGLTFWWCRRTLQVADDPAAVACCGALVGGLAASLIHSAGDFVWYIPACMSLTVITAACVCRLRHMAAPVPDTRGGRMTWLKGLWAGGHSLRLSRLGWSVAGAGTLLVSLGMLQTRVPPGLAALSWDEYFKLSQASLALGPQATGKTSETALLMARHLEDLLRRHPDHARANLRLAGLYLRRFDLEQQRSENPMILSQIRDAALASQFPSRSAQDAWLSVVTGQNRKLLDQALQLTKHGLRLCPLQGEGYVDLAELSFLDGSSSESKRAYVAQALKVRPYSGPVLMAAGNEAVLTGDAVRAFEFWKQAFQRDPEQRSQLIELLAAKLPADVFIQQFAPDTAGLGALYYFYLRQNLPEQARQVGAGYVTALENMAGKADGPAAAGMWAQAADVHNFLGQRAQAVAAARRAVVLAPDDFNQHKTLAILLLGAGDYAEALRELKWCVSRVPDDQSLQPLLQTASREQLQHPGDVLRQARTADTLH